MGLLCIIAFSIYYAIQFSRYNKSTYKAITHNSFFAVWRDKGKYGEYEIYRMLKNYEEIGYKFLFNVYLPKDDGKTTELDVLLIGPTGVFVFESKNYSGWIFGNDRQRYWTQVLPAGRGRTVKERFYNPVWQNRKHCAILKGLLPPETKVQSVVLFSNRCEFQNVTVNSTDVVVAQRFEVRSIVERFVQNGQPAVLNVEQVFGQLFPYSQVSDDVKKAHIANIHTC